MTTVTVDADLRARLNGLTETLEMRDEQGTLLGYIHPYPFTPPGPPVGGWGPFTAEEVAAAFARPDPADPGRPLADILADLRKS